MLELVGLTKSFGGVRAVDKISLTLNKGEVLGFLGPNGAGKSTTMRMIAGVLSVDEGDALINGHSITAERLAAQAALGYLPEGAPLYDEMTPPGFLRFLGSARGMDKKTCEDAVERVTADARIGAVSGKRIGSLSKGFRRRVGLAGAILTDPPVLLLDEPTDGLDPNQKRAVRALIARMATEKAILITKRWQTPLRIMADSSACLQTSLTQPRSSPHDDVHSRHKQARYAYCGYIRRVSGCL